MTLVVLCTTAKKNDKLTFSSDYRLEILTEVLVRSVCVYVCVCVLCEVITILRVLIAMCLHVCIVHLNGALSCNGVLQRFSPLFADDGTKAKSTKVQKVPPPLPIHVAPPPSALPVIPCFQVWLAGEQSTS